MKYSQYIGMLAAIALVVSGFMNLAWYPDIKEYFTGFYSYNNTYGRPGRVFIIIAVIAIAAFLIPRVWAKRFNMFFCVLSLGYVLKTFILFSGCYKGICPVKQPGLWIMLAAAVIMLAASLLPDLKVKQAS